MTYAQNRDGVYQPNCYKKLRQFALQRQTAYEQQQQAIKHFLKRYRLEQTMKIGNGGIQTLVWIKNGRPIYQMTHNVGAATTISAELLWPTNSSSFQLDGTNVEVGIWDGGEVYASHQEFADQDRLWQRDTPAFLLSHSTHIAGTIGALGVNPLSQGIANNASLLAYDYSNDVAEMALAAAEGLALSNHSYGTVCGWKYNTDADRWYWYGAIELNSLRDEAFGHYDSTAWEVDYIAYNAPYYLMVKSAGNDRNEGPTEQPVVHYDWIDGWTTASDSHELDGAPNGYDCLTPKAVAKNNLVVGSILDLPTGYTDAAAVELASYSAWGPSNDGRIKPDLVSNGESVLSSVNGAKNAYDTYSGTSMAAASASGTIALLLQLQEQLTPGRTLLSSTLKGILINTANECGSSIGPDYQHGWGLLNAYGAALCIEKNYASGGALIHEGSIELNETKSYPITIGESQEELKVTLCWTDPPGNVQDATQLKAPSLINNLDLSIENISSGEIYYPWVLNPDKPTMAASTGVNNLDNVEQVLIQSPPSGEYLIKVCGKAINVNNQQNYSLIINDCQISKSLYPPKNLSYRIGSNLAHLYWEPSEVTPLEYIVYCNNQPVAQINDTTLTLIGLTNNTTYEYYIKACFDNGQLSLPTNTVKVTPFEAVSTPFVTDFETGLNNWQIEQNIDGWQLGNKEAETSYYLNLEDNEGQFIWIDSGINSLYSHVTDVAVSPPINLENCSNITVSFRYVFVTGIYDIRDQLHLVYRQVGDTEWTKVIQPAPTSKWLETSYILPDDAAKANVQIGFYYDDFYLHGMGAAIDDIVVTSTIATNLKEVESPPIVIIQDNRVKISVQAEQNGSGNWELYEITGRQIESGQMEFIQGKADIILKSGNNGLYLLCIHYAKTCHTYKLMLRY